MNTGERTKKKKLKASKNKTTTMLVTVLKHKKLPNTYGHIVHLTPYVSNIYPTNIPDLFPSTTTLDTLKGVQRGKGGNWETVIEEYEMDSMELLNPIN